MSNAHIYEQLKKVAEIAKKQRDGGYTTESDAVIALNLIETMALALIELHGPPAGPHHDIIEKRWNEPGRT